MLEKLSSSDLNYAMKKKIKKLNTEQLQPIAENEEIQHRQQAGRLSQRSLHHRASNKTIFAFLESDLVGPHHWTSTIRIQMNGMIADTPKQRQKAQTLSNASA